MDYFFVTPMEFEMNCWRASHWISLRSPDAMGGGIKRQRRKKTKQETLPLVIGKRREKEEREAAVLGSTDCTWMQITSQKLWDRPIPWVGYLSRPGNSRPRPKLSKQKFVSIGPSLPILYPFPYRIPYHDMNYSITAGKNCFKLIIFRKLLFSVLLHMTYSN